ncbi:MAG: hypothetical protein ACRDOM_07930 [Nocardioides sp.]
MGIFATGGRTASPAHPEARAAELSEKRRSALPARFEAVGEALASGWGAVDACAVVGRELALAGTSLDEALQGLATTWRVVRRTEPRWDASRALAVAWSEATLDYLHQLTCADPVTGLASLAHLQSRVLELYRGQLRGRGPAETHALVVVDTHRGASTRDIDGRREAVDVFAGDLQVARMAEVVRTVFLGEETLGILGGSRLVVITRRDDRLGQRVGLLRRLLLGRCEPAAATPRVWIEGLPPSEEAAATVLSELARL